MSCSSVLKRQKLRSAALSGGVMVYHTSIVEMMFMLGEQSWLHVREVSLETRVKCCERLYF